MKRKFSSYILLSVAGCFCLATLLPSCSKDELNSKELLVFLQAGKQGIATKTETVAFVHNPVGVMGDRDVELFAYASREVAAAVDLQLEEDPSQVDAYNALNKTSCIALPAANFKLSGGNKYTIPQGALQSNPIRIEILNPEQLNDPAGYLLPLKITSIGSADKGVAVSSTHSTVYVRVTYEFNNIVQTQTPVSGVLAARTGWVVTVSNTTNGAPGSAMLDGSNTTSWRSSNSSSAAKWASVDMGSAQQIKGFQLVPNYVSASENATKITVSTSPDNTTWTVQGVWNGTGPATGSSAANPDLKGINFAAPVNARYFRFDINALVSGNRAGIAEVNIVQ